MTHPSIEELALFAGGELGWFGHRRVNAHLSGCESCRRAAESFAAARGILRDHAAQEPAEVDWDELAAEMKANIRLGLAAGEAVAPAPATVPALGWRPAMGIALATLVVVAGWFLNVPKPALDAGRQVEGVVLEATQTGLELRENGRVLTLLHPASTSVTYTAHAEGALRARYVDSDTGQVTITNVYAQ